MISMVIKMVINIEKGHSTLDKPCRNLSYSYARFVCILRIII